jgi:hypothetical protein
MRNAYKIVIVKREEERLPKDLGVDGRVILKSILGK